MHYRSMKLQVVAGIEQMRKQCNSGPLSSAFHMHHDTGVCYGIFN